MTAAVHLDTDFAGNPDDAFALAMLLGWPDVDITGVTTVADPDGRRAGYVKHVLRLVGRDDVPVASGAAVSGTTGLPMGGLPHAQRYWGGPVDPLLSPSGAAVELLDRSIGKDATVVAIGPYTNLAELERVRPGRLAAVPVYAMGGWLGPLDPDLPAWEPRRDWNVQCDTDAAVTLLRCTDVTWVPIAVTARAHLRATHVARLDAGGSLGSLLARQARAHAVERDLASLARDHAELPADLLAFMHDPLTCAVALGWPGVRVEPVALRAVIDADGLRFDRSPGGHPSRVVTAVDGPAFVDRWLAAVESIQRPIRCC